MQAQVTTAAADLARLILTARDEATRRALLAVALKQLIGVADDADGAIEEAADRIRADLMSEAETLLEQCRDERVIDWTLNTSEGMRLAEGWWREKYAAKAERVAA